MAKNTSISLENHFEDLINSQMMQGRYGSASDSLLDMEATRLEAKNNCS